MFTEELWEGWSKQEEANYKTVKDKKGFSRKKYLKKGYTHFDNRFWFPERKEEFKKIIQGGLKIHNHHLKRDEWWAFSPFLKILLKTPRFKYQNELGHYDLETKIRPICFAAHVDSLIFGYYSFYLTREYEKYIKANDFDECVLAYRSDLGKSNIQFSKEVFDYVKHKGNCTAVALDIKGYFDHIDHKILKEKWSNVIGKNLPEDQFKIFKALTQYSYVSKNSLLKKYNVNLKKLRKAKAEPKTILELVPGKKDFEKFDRLRADKLFVTNKKPNIERQIGVPQGSALSALLSNIYLIDYDKMMFEKAKEEGFMYRRYCDDIVIVCDTDKAQELQKFAIDKIKEDYLLTIQDGKVEVTEFRANAKGKIRAFNKKKMIEKGIESTDASSEKYYYKSLQYLGFEFNGQDIFIRSSSLSRYFRKMKSRIVKTVSMAYGEKGKTNKIFMEQLLHRYSHLGKRNFLSYVYNAARGEYKNAKGELKEGMNSPAIKRQVKRHVTVLCNALEIKNANRFQWKEKKGKASAIKKI